MPSKPSSDKLAGASSPAALTVAHLQTIAQGLARPRKGQPTRAALKAYLEVFDDPKTTQAERNECIRLATQSLGMAHGIGTGELKMKRRSLS